MEKKLNLTYVYVYNTQVAQSVQIAYWINTP